MSTNDPAFWVMVTVAVSFVVIAVTMIVIAVVVGRLVKMVGNVERRVEPLIERMGALADQVRQLAVQGKDVAEQVTLMSGHLSTASMHFSESMALIKDEVGELKLLVGVSAETAREKVALIGQSIDQTHGQLVATTSLINSKIVGPAREIAAIMAGVRRGLEVLVAPTPKPINQTYGEDEMFIG
jgi:C4-dicarboxylate-specific signal transduction histidine kinase